MARIAGVNIEQDKNIRFALTDIFGIGMFRAEKILKEANIKTEKKTKELKSTEINRINDIIEKNYEVEGELKQKIFRNIKRLKDIRSYRGLRHKLGLPVRGQKTRTNAVTRKGKNIAVGGLKHKLEKK